MRLPIAADVTRIFADGSQTVARCSDKRVAEAAMMIGDALSSRDRGVGASIMTQLRDDLGRPRPTGLQLTARDPAFRENPHESLDELRTSDPVHQDRELGRFVLTRADDIAAVLA